MCRVPNACDVCPDTNDDQTDTDNDGKGDKCGASGHVFSGDHPFCCVTCVYHCRLPAMCAMRDTFRGRSRMKVFAVLQVVEPSVPGAALSLLSLVWLHMARHRQLPIGTEPKPIKCRLVTAQAWRATRNDSLLHVACSLLSVPHSHHTEHAPCR